MAIATPAEKREKIESHGGKQRGSENKQKLEIKRVFTYPNKDPYESVEWGIRDAVAGDFEQKGVEAPLCWSDSAVGIVAKLYFATIDGVRESSVKTLIRRVVTKITDEGIKHGYFDEEDSFAFEAELAYILINQFAAFNTPVWLNLGVPGKKQCCSACYLLNVEDTMFGEDSITEWWSNEAAIFRSGGGSGVNLSKLRGSMEPLSTGGISSGPVSFMRPADSSAGTFKSGGTSRRAAKLVCLDVDHPDILDFIDCKVREDRRMRTLVDAGFNLDPSTLEGEKNIAESTSFQNANISVRLSDKFMKAVEEDEEWYLTSRLDNRIISELPARDLLLTIAMATWRCADPGVMFDDTINGWHSTPSLGRINTANPCCETNQNDNTSCNLASLNLVKFLDDKKGFLFKRFNQVVDIMITAMDITCSFSELPTKKIEENTRNLRQLGLGYSNLGAALMVQGMPYDSDEGREWAASVTSLMTGRAYKRSAELAELIGSFAYYKDNIESMNDVILKHRDACYNAKGVKNDNIIWGNALDQWHFVADKYNSGYRNSQVTVIAPTGTISFFMDCDTTGAEPLFAPITYKKLASGGTIKQKPSCYSEAVKKYKVNNMIFQTASDNELMKIPAISADGHIKMLAAIQPHISGAISKSVNLPESATMQDVYDTYFKAWKMGIKCLAIYRDGSKATQVLSNKKTSDQDSMQFKTGEKFWEKEKLFQVQEDGTVCEVIVNQKDFLKNETENSPIEKNSDFVAQKGMKNKGRPSEVIGRTGMWHKEEKEDEIVEEVENRNQIAENKDPIPWKDKHIPQFPSVWKFDPNEKDHLKKSLEVYSKESRRRMKSERRSITHKFKIGDHEGYITAGMFDDGTLGEIFLSGIGKEGSTLRGIMDAFAISISLGLQHGVPLETLAEKFSHMNFEPKGLTNNPEIRTAHSMPDYIMRWLVSKFGDKDLCDELGIRKEIIKKENFESSNRKEKIYNITSTNGKAKIDYGKACSCGAIMVRTGTCWGCPNCGHTTGCI